MGMYMYCPQCNKKLCKVGEGVFKVRKMQVICRRCWKMVYFDSETEMYSIGSVPLPADSSGKNIF